MLRTELPAASVILDEAIQLADQDSVDREFALDDTRTLLVDGGRPGSSIIMDHAVALASEARHIWYVSQFSPAPALARTMKRCPGMIEAKFNNPKNSEHLPGKVAALVDRLITAVPNAYDGDPRIHAKVLVVEKSDGMLEAISGSHNFSAWGVRFGTKEMALQTRNQSDCEQLREYAISV